MTIDYALYKNKLTEDTDLYAARTLITQSADLETIADRIVEQNSVVSRTDCLAVLESSISAVQSLLLEGYRVNFGGLFDLFPKIKGKFDSMADRYDPSRHKLDLAAAPGSRVRKYFRDNATAEKLNTVLPTPLVLEYDDLGSGTKNTIVSLSSIGTIRGSRLSFNEEDATEGIFFVSTMSGDEVKITAIQRNKPSELVFQIPSTLPANIYLEVRKHFSEGGDLRIGRLPYVLSLTASNKKPKGKKN
ncbi:MAG: DUF4469 domain-containing protein [Sedimentisphaerales bacterium]|nr:DUF4469 domain-containing protein [Sedimentisphaerales bacterium]